MVSLWFPMVFLFQKGKLREVVGENQMIFHCYREIPKRTTPFQKTNKTKDLPIKTTIFTKEHKECLIETHIMVSKGVIDPFTSGLEGILGVYRFLWQVPSAMEVGPSVDWLFLKGVPILF